MPKASPAKGWDKSRPRSGPALLCGRAVCTPWLAKDWKRWSEQMSPCHQSLHRQTGNAGQRSSPQINWAFWRGAMNTVCAQTCQCRAMPKREGQLATWLTLRLKSPPLLIASPLQHLLFVYKTSQIPATAIATRGWKSCLAWQQWEAAGIGKGAATEPTCHCLSSKILRNFLRPGTCLTPRCLCQRAGRSAGARGGADALRGREVVW